MGTARAFPIAHAGKRLEQCRKHPSDDSVQKETCGEASAGTVVRQARRPTTQVGFESRCCDVATAAVSSRRTCQPGSRLGATLYLCRAACQLVTTVRGGVVGASPTASSTRNWLPSVEGWYVFPLLSGSSMGARNSSWGALKVSSGPSFTSTAIILGPDAK